MYEYLEKRCLEVLVSMKFAKAQYKDNDDDNEFEHEAPRRVLLEVEQRAHFKKDRSGENKLAISHKARTEISDRVIERIMPQLADTDYMYGSVLECPDAIPACLDILQVRTASIGRIYPLIADMSWISKNILHIVNMPQYRNPNNPDVDVKVTNLRLAMSYLGIDNLKIVIPSAAIRNFIPRSTEPFTLLKRKMWDATLSCALSCQSLARQTETDAFSAFCAGMFYYLGHLAIIDLYLSTFNELKASRLEVLRKEGLHQEHEMLYDVVPDEEVVCDLLFTHARELSLRLLEKMEFKRLFITPSLKELLDHDGENTLSERAQLIQQGVAYSQYRMLERHSLITNIEAGKWFKSIKLDKNKLKKLQTVRLNRLNLSFDR